MTSTQKWKTSAKEGEGRTEWSNCFPIVSIGLLVRIT